MKATGIVRRIDDLGRVVVPKEIRRTLRIREGDPLEIFTDREGEIIFKKIFPPSGSCPHLRGSMRKAWRRPRGAWSVSAIWIRSWQQQAAGKMELTDKYISSQLMKLLGERTATTFPGQEKMPASRLSVNRRETISGR